MNMANPAIGSITEHTVAALSAGRDTVVWDRALAGFGVRVYPVGRQGLRGADAGSRWLQAHHRGPPRGDRGRRGPPPRRPHHRRHPRRRMTQRSRGIRSQRASPSQTLAERYLREHVAVRCKPTTAAQYRLAIERYIVPALGTLPRYSSLSRSAGRRSATCAQPTGPTMANLVVATALTDDRTGDGLGRRGGDEQSVPLCPESTGRAGASASSRTRSSVAWAIDPRRA